MAKVYKCKYGDGVVSEFGSYVKLGASERAHLKCFAEDMMRQGAEARETQILEEKARERVEQAERERKEREEQQAREKAETDRRAEVEERERTNRILAEKAMPLPPKVVPSEVKAPEPKKDEPKPDRFDLLDLD